MSQAKVDAVVAERNVKGTTSYDEVLSDPEVDAVALLLPHAIHHETAKAALQAGKHVCVEKPITVTAREAQDLIETAEAGDLTSRWPRTRATCAPTSRPSG